MENNSDFIQILLEKIEKDDLPTNVFDVEGTDPLVLLGKMNEIIGQLSNFQSSVNSSNTTANEALSKAEDAVDLIRMMLILTLIGGDNLTLHLELQIKQSAHQTQQLKLQINRLKLHKKQKTLQTQQIKIRVKQSPRQMRQNQQQKTHLNKSHRAWEQKSKTI